MCNCMFTWKSELLKFKLLYLRTYISYFNKICRISCVNTHMQSLKVWLKSVLPWLKYSIFSRGLFFYWRTLYITSRAKKTSKTYCLYWLGALWGELDPLKGKVPSRDVWMKYCTKTFPVLFTGVSSSSSSAAAAAVERRRKRAASAAAMFLGLFFIAYQNLTGRGC